MSGSVNKVIHLYTVDKLSIPQIAALVEVPISRVRQDLLRAGVAMRSRGDGVRLRRDVLGVHLVGTKRPMRAATKKKLSIKALIRGEKTAKGVSKKPNGYIEHTRGVNKGRSVHVVKMEARLGRRLKADEIVHHIDGNRENNACDNLALMTRAGHTRHHRMFERKKK